MLKIVLLTSTLLMPVQYGGPPMWDRNADDYSVPRGPQGPPCIRNADCWGAERQLRYPPGWYDPQYERPMRRIPRFPQRTPNYNPYEDEE
jgi:hypothetical protein